MSNVSEETNNLNAHQSQDSLATVQIDLVENQKQIPRKLEIWEHITRNGVRANKDKIFRN